MSWWLKNSHLNSLFESQNGKTKHHKLGKRETKQTFRVFTEVLGESLFTTLFDYYKPQLPPCVRVCFLTSSRVATAFLQWVIRVEKLEVVGAL